MSKFFHKLFPKGISGSAALFILTLVVITHVVLTYVFIEKNRTVLRRANRDEIIQKIVNAIHLVEATPALNRSNAIAALADPDLKVTLTPEPKFDLRFTQISFWAISKALHSDLESFAISIRLDDDLWLNLNATIYYHFLFTQILLISLEAIVFGAILFAAWSINRFTRPLKDFKRAAEELGMDLHAKPLVIYGPGIVRETAEAMNTMQQKIQDLVKDRTLMLAAISHDLRTPITRLKLRAQFMEDHELYPKMIADLDEMESMISQTLTFAREEHTTEEKKKLDLCSFIELICDEMQDVGYDVNFETSEKHIPFYARPMGLKRALSNLINNAIKYGNRADVQIKIKSKKTIVITIEDQGPGIPEKELKNVLQPFYRADPSRSRDTGGVGLGLAVAQDIIHYHGGKIKLKNLRQKGLQVSVIFPVLSDEV